MTAFGQRDAMVNLGGNDYETTLFAVFAKRFRAKLPRADMVAPLPTVVVAAHTTAVEPELNPRTISC